MDHYTLDDVFAQLLYTSTWRSTKKIQKDLLEGISLNRLLIDEDIKDLPREGGTKYW